MSKSGKQVSEKALAEPQNPSVYDFLYCDTRRIGSFLSQFDDSGHLEKVVQKEAVTVGSKRGYKVALGGGGTLAGTGAQGSAGFEISPVAGGSEASERVYDPLWTNARTFLDYIDGAGLINRGVTSARIGQFTLVSGNLAIFDLSVLKGAWDVPYLRTLIYGGNIEPEPQFANRKQRLANKGQIPKSGKQTEMDGILEILKLMPHGIVCSLMENGTNVWSNLSAEYLVGQSSDIALKHGAVIPGSWNILGILDALPNKSSQTALTNESAQQLISIMGLGTLGQLIAGFAPAIKTTLGRPDAAYGITPLLIFRQVS